MQLHSLAGPPTGRVCTRLPRSEKVSIRHKSRAAFARRPSLPKRCDKQQASTQKFHCEATGSTGERSAEASIGGGGTGRSDNGSGGGGDGHSGGSGGNGPGGALGLLLALGRSVESFPLDIATGIKNGQVSAELLQRYLDLEKNFFLRFFLKFAGSRERLLGDPGFPVKLAIELGIGITMKIAAELNKRGDRFHSELDFVFANVVMAIIADTMLVWLPAPRASFAAKQSSGYQSDFTRWFKSCPDNAFQVVPAGQANYTVAQRTGAVVRNGAKLLGVGFGSSLFGVGLTNALTGIKQLIDPDFVPLNKPQGVLVTSAAYGTYMAWNSNLRYQIIAGVVEERGIERLFKGNQAICGLLSFAVRTGNTFLGSSMWIDYLRLLGLQKAPGH